MPAVSDLYQSLILEHSKRPQHYGALSQTTHSAEGYNPLCGDHVEVFLQLERERIVSLSFKAAAQHHHCIGLDDGLVRCKGSHCGMRNSFLSTCKPG